MEVGCQEFVAKSTLTLPGKFGICEQNMKQTVKAVSEAAVGVSVCREIILSGAQIK